MAGKRVFLCYAPEDYERRVPVVAALDAWEVPHSGMDSAPLPWQEIPPAIGKAIEECEVFLRLCTPAISVSREATLATDYFRQLLEQDRRQRHRQHTKRVLVNLILDTNYRNDPRDVTRLYIATAGKERALWLEELAAPLGVATVAQRVSRRAVLGMGAGITVAVVASTGAGVLLEEQRQTQAAALAAAEKVLPVTQSSGQPRWTAQLGTPDTGPLPDDIPLLALDGNSVYAWTSDGVFALSAVDGTKRHIPLDFRIDTFDVLAADFSGASQMFAAGDGKLLLRKVANTNAPHNASNISAARSSDGKFLWQTAVADSGTPVVADGMVYSMVYYDDLGYNTISAFRATDGARMWRQHLSVGFGNFYPTATPLLAAADGRVYAGSFDHYLYCFDGQSGKVRWKFLMRGDPGTPTVDGETIYAGSEEGAVYALNAGNGALRWRYVAERGVIGAPTVRDGVVYAGSRDGYLHAVEAATGRLYWKAFAGTNVWQDGADSHTIVTQPALYRNIAFASFSTNLFAFDIGNGTQRWAFKPVDGTSGALVSPPVVAGNRVLIGGLGKKVYAINP